MLAAPNIRSLYYWEADLLSVTPARLVHEFEIKVSLADFRADKNKKAKHSDLLARHNGPKRKAVSPQRPLFYRGTSSRTPNYFWYATNGFSLADEEIPDYAGWLEVNFNDGWDAVVKKEAPRLHMDKVTHEQINKLGRSLSYRLMDAYFPILQALWGED